MKTIFIILTSTILLSALHFSTNAVADDKPKNEKDQVGRFQLHIVKKGEDNILYRIDSVTGNVSVFDPNSQVSLSSTDLKYLEPRMKEVAEKLLSDGKILIENPYWKLIPEKLNGFGVIGK